MLITAVVLIHGVFAAITAEHIHVNGLRQLYTKTFSFLFTRKRHNRTGFGKDGYL